MQAGFAPMAKMEKRGGGGAQDLAGFDGQSHFQQPFVKAANGVGRGVGDIAAGEIPLFKEADGLDGSREGSPVLEEDSVEIEEEPSGAAYGFGLHDCTEARRMQ